MIKIIREAILRLRREASSPPPVPAPPALEDEEPSSGHPAPATAQIACDAQACAGSDAAAFFACVTGLEPDPDPQMRLHEKQFVGTLDQLLASDLTIANWIPRPPAVLPRLLNCLRDHHSSLQDAAGIIRQDAYLMTEVIRLSNSAMLHRGIPTTDLTHATARLGVEGLRRAVSATLLRPLFDAQRDRLLGHAMPKLWEHAEIKSLLCQQLAQEMGVKPFDAYLAGLTHNVGWIGILKAMDRGPFCLSGPFSSGLIDALERRSERFFVLGAEQWTFNPALMALARIVREGPLREASDPMAQLLCRADRQTTAELASKESLATSAPTHD